MCDTIRGRLVEEALSHGKSQDPTEFLLRHSSDSRQVRVRDSCLIILWDQSRNIEFQQPPKGGFCTELLGTRCQYLPRLINSTAGTIPVMRCIAYVDRGLFPMFGRGRDEVLPPGNVFKQNPTTSLEVGHQHFFRVVILLVLSR